MTTPVMNDQDFLKRMRMHGLEARFTDLLWNAFWAGADQDKNPTFEDWFTDTYEAQPK